MKRIVAAVVVVFALSMGIPGHALAAGNSQNPCVGQFASGSAGPGYGQIVSGFAREGLVGPVVSSLATSCNPA
jgi:hypothetical protein